MEDCLTGIPRPNDQSLSDAQERELAAAPVSVELDVAYARGLYNSLSPGWRDTLRQSWEQFESIIARLSEVRMAAMELATRLDEELERLDREDLEEDATVELLDRDEADKALRALAEELPLSKLSALVEIARGISRLNTEGEP